MGYDVAVIGTGAMGGAAAYHLAKSGAKVIAFDQHTVPHDRGSSHAETRLIRQAYFEDPNYVPLLRRAYELWTDLEKNPGDLFVRNGLFVAGNADRTIMSGIRHSASEHNIAIEIMDADAARSRFPAFHFENDDQCIFEPGAGYLKVDDVLNAHINGAKSLGADIYFNTEVISLARTIGGFAVKTQTQQYEVKKVVIAAGAWISKLLPNMAHHLTPHRVPLFWFETNQLNNPINVCYAFDLPEGFFYGFPPIGAPRIKTGLHKPGMKIQNPSQFDRVLADNERNPVRKFVEQRLPFASRHIVHEATCIYTMTADEHFIIDEDDGLVILSGCSGHGFKFASVIGEIGKDLALEGKTTLPINFLRMR